MDNYKYNLEVSAQKLRDAYSFIHANRRRVIFLDHKSLSNKTVEKTVQPIIICKAINMNGSPCSCKAKSNGLCGRHLKK